MPANHQKGDRLAAFKVEGPIDFSLTGILSSQANPRAENEIPIFVVSTFDTDYLLVESKYFTNVKSLLGKFCTVKE